MKILSLTLQNLNSLKGNWHIDFTDPAYDDSGIFAITGQTGAGKTTILDAICLALYGKTPRVEIISKSTNEVMSRGCFECMAEIEIDIKGKVYRCHWSQYRARKKSNGNLQDITHTISQLENLGDNEGKILESKSSLTKKVIIDTVNMDFEQFTRSVLLAQGDFSKFLKAKSEDRANILEKITGTDIYANISRRVFERKRTNEQKLKELTASIDGIELLSTEEHEQIKNQLVNQKDEQEKYSKTISTLNEQINWQHTITKLNQAIANQKNELATAKQTQINFSVNAEKLTYALKALEIESNYQQFERTVNQHKQLTIKEDTLKQQLPCEQDNLIKANTEIETKEHALKHAEKILAEQIPIIHEIKDLDNTINVLKQRLDDSQNQQIQLNNNFNNCTQHIIDNENEAEKTQKELKHINDYLTENPSHAHLNLDRDKLINICKTIRDLLFVNASIQDELNKHKEHGEQIINNQKDIEQHLTVLDNQVTHHKNHVSQLEVNINNLLNGITMSEWRTKLVKFNNYQNELTVLNQHNIKLNQYIQEIEQLTIIQCELETEKTQLNTKIEYQNNTLNELEQQHSDKQNTLALQHQVIKLEQYIVDLQANESCPLCGSIEHPYLSDLHNGSHPHFNPSSSRDNDNNLQQQIEEINSKIKHEQQQLNQTKQDLAVNTNQHKNNYDKQENFNQQFLELLPLFKDTLTASSQSLSHAFINKNTKEVHIIMATLTDQIENEKIKNSNNQQTCYDLIEKIEELEKELEKSKYNSQKINEECNEAKNNLNKILSQKELHEQKIIHINTNISHNFTNMHKQHDALEQVLTRHSLTVPNQLSTSLQQNNVLREAEIESILDTLREIAKAWGNSEKIYLNKNQHKIELEKSISNLQFGLTELHKNKHQAQLDLDKTLQVVNQQQVIYQNKVQQREKVFGDKNPTEEESNLRQKIKDAQMSFSAAKEIQQASQYKITEITKNLTDLVAQISDSQNILNDQEAVFNKQLQNNNFTNIEHFKSAILPQKNREELQRQQAEINGEVNRLQTLLQSNEKILLEQSTKKLTTLPLEQLQASKNEIENTANQLAQKIGAHEQIISDNEARKVKSSQQQKAIDKQKSANQIWEQLNILIGSSEGKKFRIFAQGLTFDDMICGANEQLQKMSDRYLLIRDKSEGSKEPLELNVVDNYQAGEIRSCKNLSGGESFIISLALALGLSKMASHHANNCVNRNMSVDSLFLDEGFGTLDEDSLDIALDTLTHLRQQGKLIGVISHVQGLKDRIHTQIKVEKISGGVSRISGAGVTMQ